MLGTARGYSGFAVDDMAKAREFYGETLGLDITDGPGGGTAFLSIAEGHETLVYPKPDFVPATYTILNFEVADAEATVDELNARGVEMERYEGFDQDEKGIARVSGFPPGAWFTDPAGNIIGVHEPMP